MLAKMIILKPSSKSTRNGLSGPTDSSVPIFRRSFTVNLIAATCTTALPGGNVVYNKGYRPMNRVLSIDVMRGFALMCMVLVHFMIYFGDSTAAST